MKEFLDEVGGRYIVQRVKQMINAIEADYVTKAELQAELDALNIDIDLSAYATKEELTDALSNIDLSAYATKEYVTDAINNAQLGGDGSSVDLSIYAKKSDLNSKADTEHTHTMSDITDYKAPDLSNYYTKDETYSKEEVDTAIENARSHTFDPNFDFSGKTLYFDTTKNLASMLPEEQYILYISDPTSTGYNYGQSIAWNEFSNSPNGRLTLTMGIDDTGFGVRSNIILYDINCADGEKSQMGTFNNHWATSSYTFSSKFKTPVYGDFGDESKSILGEELFNAFMSCVTRVVDADGNEVSFKPEEIISPTVSITETDNGHTVSITDVNGTQSFDVTNGIDGVTPHIDETTKHWFIGDTDTGILAEGTNGTNGTNGVDGTDGQDGQDGRGIISTKFLYGHSSTPNTVPTSWSDINSNLLLGEYRWVKVEITYSDNTTESNYISYVYSGKDGTNGTNGVDGQNGTDGYTPVRGTDYWTQEDIDTIKAYIDTELGVIENGSY